MTQGRLYKVHVPEVFDYTAESWEEDYSEPEGWREFAIQHPRIEDDADFFLPNDRKIFRSRSAATNHLARFTRWNVNAFLVECTPQWETIPAANARRAKERTRA